MSRQTVIERRQMDALKARGEWSNISFSKDRAFKHNLSIIQKRWLRDNFVMPDPLVLDITAGGGSIPFETGRLGLRSHANELNPVAFLILRASCQWPQQFGYKLLTCYESIGQRFKKRVNELLEDVYPEEFQPISDDAQTEKFGTARAHRYVWAYLWARAVPCPSCQGQIPLSPNWRLDAQGTGIKLLPDETTGRCAFAIVNSLTEQSPGTVRRGIATCPFPYCGATTEKNYLSQEAQAGRMGHQLYCVIYRDQWPTRTQSGRLSKRPKTQRGFRAVTPEDDNTAGIIQRLAQLQSFWEANDILPSELVPEGNKTKEPHRYGMPYWKDMFSPRQQLAHGYCVQAFRELVDEDRQAGLLNELRKAAYSYLALGIDKIINRNCLRSFWDPGTNKVAHSFATHDFGMKWSYAEMAITIEGLGLDWALKDLQGCLSELVTMSGHVAPSNARPRIDDGQGTNTVAIPSVVTCESADMLLSVPDKSVDAIVFDPPYYDNVNYAELSDFFYVWLKRTAGYVYPDLFSQYLTDKTNEAIASPARVRNETGAGKGTGPVKQRAYEDYVERMRRIFAECHRVLKDDGILTLMFTHKATEAWDALTIGLIEAGFRITATWPVKTEAEASLNIRDRAAARSTILLACRPRHQPSAGSFSWETVERLIAAAVRDRLTQLEAYDLKPLDVYLASFGPALEVISTHWPLRREVAKAGHHPDPFAVTPNDALQVARKEVFDARRRKISALWADNPSDALTEFYILARDSAGSATLPFDEANLVARCLGLELGNASALKLYGKKGANINLFTAKRRLEAGLISPAAPALSNIDRVHTAVALAENEGVNVAINWCVMHDFQDDAPFKGTLEALLRLMPASDPDWLPSRNLWTEMYREEAPPPAGIQASLFQDELIAGDE